MHIIVFFIILVANVGGALTPLGDPPLFVGFLRGVDFFWTARHLWMQTLIAAVLILTVFFLLDLTHYRREAPLASPAFEPLGMRGRINLLLMGLIIVVILGSAASNPAIEFDVVGAKVALQSLLRDAALIVIALLSLRLTPDEHRAANGFTWEPIKEVAVLFAAIFIAIIPVQAMLTAGPRGAFAALLSFVSDGRGDPTKLHISG